MIIDLHVPHPSGNGRKGLSVHPATRKLCSIMETVDWYNVTPKVDVLLLTTPTNMIHHYQVRLIGIDAATLPAQDEM